MKNFFKHVFANIVALLILGGITFGFIVVMLISSATSSEDKKVDIQDNSILVLDFKTNIIDSDTESETSILEFDKEKDLRIYDIIEAIKTAKSDHKIKGISIEVGFINAGKTQIDDIRNAVEDFKSSGKFVYTYGNVVSQPSYYLGSVADQYFLNPAGGIELKGLSSEVVFLKEFAEKYGIGLDVIRHGKFKAAVEPLLRNDISDENKEQLATLLNDVWSSYSTKMIQSRKIAPDHFKTVVDSLYGAIPELCVEHRLVDRLNQKSEYDKALKTKLKLEPKDHLKKVSIAKYISATVEKEDEDTVGEIAVLYASGEIYTGNDIKNIYSENYVKHIQELAEDDDIKAVVLRINSPGGSSNASDQILFELQQLKQKKPLIVSFGDYAASGGYYIAMAGDKIYSEPNTITGSIGVFGVIPNVKNLANRNGIRADVVATHANSNLYSPISGISPGAIEMMSRGVERTYKRFIHFVGKNRKKSFDEVDAIASGRVWSGKRAKEIGLVDELGTLQDAIKYAASKVKIKDYSVSSYPKKINRLEYLLKSMSEEKIAASFIKSKIGEEHYDLFEKVTHPKLQNDIQMALPYQISIK